MNTCPKCQKPTLLSEGVGDGKVRRNCRSCGFTEVKDSQGRQLLTDDRASGGGAPPSARPGYLTEG